MKVDWPHCPRWKLGKLYQERTQYFNEHFLDDGRYLTLVWVSNFLHLVYKKKLTIMLKLSQVPFLIRSAQDIEELTPYHANLHIMADDECNPTSLSILTGPYKIAKGINFGLDIFTSTESQFKKHAMGQLHHLVHLLKKENYADLEEASLMLACTTKFFPIVQDFFGEELKVFETGHNLYRPAVEEPLYFIYEKLFA